MVDQDQVKRVTVFTHISTKGVQRVFNIDSLTTHLKLLAMAEKLDIIETGVDPVFAAFCLENRGIEPHRLGRITVHSFQTPLIMCYDVGGDKTHLMVDGHHRYVKAWQMGWDSVLCAVAEPAIWEQHLIMDLPEESAETLKTKYSGIH